MLPDRPGAQRVACPKCRHQALAAAFTSPDAPLPVVMVANEAEPSDDGAADGDDARTYMMIQTPWQQAAADGNDDGKTIATGLVAPVLPPSRRRAVSAAPARSGAGPDDTVQGVAQDLIRQSAIGQSAVAPRSVSPRAANPRSVSPRAEPPPRNEGKQRSDDDERTHLLLDVKDLLDDGEPPAPSSQRKGPGSQRASMDDDATRLLMGPLSVPAQPQTPVGRVVRALSRLLPPALRLSVWLDELLHERWLWALRAWTSCSAMARPRWASSAGWRRSSCYRCLRCRA
jgi:hypothetical protein